MTQSETDKAHQGAVEGATGGAPTQRAARMGLGGGLGGRIASGAAWIVGGRFLMRFIGLANTLIVARLLVPEDFGLIAIGFTALQILQGFSDFGVSQYVVKHHDANRDDYETIWTFSLLRGVGLACLMALLGPVLAYFFHEPRLVWMFLAIALMPLLEGLLNPKFYEFERALNFSREFIAIGLNKFVAVAVSITMALILRNYWALIAGAIAGGLVQLLLSYIFIPFRPRWSFKSKHKVFGFAGWLTAAGALITFNLKLDALIIARLFGAGPTGGFYLGMQLAQLSTNELATPLSRAIFPGLSEQQADDRAMVRTCLAGVEAMAAIAMPMAVGMGLLASDLVPLFFGPGYEKAIPVLHYVAPILGIYFLSDPIRPLVIAKGQTKIIFWRELWYLVIRLPSFIIAALLWGYMGAVIARALSGLGQLFLNLMMYRHVTGRSAFEPLLRAWRSLFAIMVMIAWFLLLRDYFPQVPTSLRLLGVLIDASMGALIYSTAHLLAWRWAGYPNGVERQILSRLPKIKHHLPERN